MLLSEWGESDNNRHAKYDTLSVAGKRQLESETCPASRSARLTASWKSLTEYRTLAGGVSAPFDHMVRRSLVAARTSASGWEGTQQGSHQPRTVAVE
jgi:hypothetical protein